MSDMLQLVVQSDPNTGGHEVGDKLMHIGQF